MLNDKEGLMLIIYKVLSCLRRMLGDYRSAIIIPLVAAFLCVNVETVEAKKKSNTVSLTQKTKSKPKKRKSTSRRRYRRKYYPDKTRARAIKMIRTHSVAVCDLLGWQPIVQNGEELDYENESEIWDEEDVKEFDSKGGLSGEETDIDYESLDINTFRKLWLSYVDDGAPRQYTAGGIDKRRLMKVIVNWLGTPYKFGGSTRKAIDCSAFIKSVFYQCSDIVLPRTARTQYKIGVEIPKEDLKFGDLIFFHTYTYRYASHVGIYLGDGLFAHASSRYGVTVSSLNSRYYTSHYIGARRLFLDDYANTRVSR